MPLTELPPRRNNLMPTRQSSTDRLARPTCASAGLLTALLLMPLTLGLGSSSVDAGDRELGPGIANHPVSVVPTEAIAIPAGWPVDAQGAIGCLTCHTEIPSGQGASGPSLRDFDWNVGQPTEFCAKCHSLPDQRTAGSLHWLALEVAHVSAYRAAPHTGGRVLDAQTRQCLSCHDGATATESKNATPWTGSRGDLGDSRRNHPVGITYDDLSRPEDLTPLRPASLLPLEVPLPGGKVACVSCHNLYAHEPYLLTVPIHGSELCLTCHDMK